MLDGVFPIIGYIHLIMALRAHVLTHTHTHTYVGFMFYVIYP